MRARSSPLWCVAAGASDTAAAIRSGLRGSGAGSAFGPALLGSVGPLVAFGAGSVLTAQTLGVGLALAPAAAAGAWVGQRILDRLAVEIFTVLVEIGLVVAGVVLVVRG